MTDIRCPECDHAFFDHPNQPTPDHDYEPYSCQQCGHYVVVPTTPEAPIDHWRLTDENATVITCLYCESDHLPFYWSGNSLDGDAEHAFKCPTCEDYLYHVRVGDPSTATSPDYSTENPFANVATTIGAYTGGHELKDGQTTLSDTDST